MPSLRTAAISGLACLGSLVGLASAATEAKLLGGVCGNYPGAMQSDTGNSYVGDLYFVPVTGTYIDTLGTHFGSILEQQRYRLPWYSLAIFNETGRAAYRIDCKDENGPTIATSGKRVLIDTDQGGTLVFDGYGLTPEPYAYYVDGVRQDGVYVGAAGEVRWAWSQRTVKSNTDSIVYWQPRLLVATDQKPDNGRLRDGEIEGFLAVKRWT